MFKLDNSEIKGLGSNVQLFYPFCVIVSIY